MESINCTKKKLVITDADGTYCQFWDYFCPAMRKFVRMMAPEFGVSEDELSRELGRVMKQSGTHEHPWILEQTSFRKKFRGTAKEFRDRFVIPFWAGLDKYRLKYLTTRWDALDTLIELKRRGIQVCVLSDAPFHMALSRAKQVGVDGLIDGLFALETPEPKAADFVDPEDMVYGLERVHQFESTPHKFSIIRKMPVSWEKPDSRGLEEVMKTFGVKPSECIFIGDSLVKDGGAAQKQGVSYIWARYGVELSAQDRELVDVHFNPDAVATDSVSQVLRRPTRVFPPLLAQAASYAEVLKHVSATPDKASLKLMPGIQPTVSKSSSGH